MKEGHCQYSKCGKKLPYVTAEGNPIPPHRRRKMKYCNNRCSRLATSAAKREQVRKLEEAKILVDNWVAGRI